MPTQCSALLSVLNTPWKNGVNLILYTVAFLLLSCISIALWPIDMLHVHSTTQAPDSATTTLYAAPMPLSQGYRTHIIHSVQRTPVEDIYRVQEGRIWGWQERIMSHNAGLPFLKPKNGRFLYDSPWMIVEGGRNSWQEIIYRVGTEELGHNELWLPFLGWIPLWKEHFKERLEFLVETLPLYKTYY